MGRLFDFILYVVILVDVHHDRLIWQSPLVLTPPGSVLLIRFYGWIAGPDGEEFHAAMCQLNIVDVVHWPYQ